MADKSEITERLITQQKVMFRLAATKGFTQELIHAVTGLPTTSLSEWATGKCKISAVGILMLADIEDFPCDLLSLLFPTGMAVIRVPSGIDHDEVERACLEYVACKSEAHRPESPMGREIAPCEDGKLGTKFAGLRAVA